MILKLILLVVAIFSLIYSCRKVVSLFKQSENCGDRKKKQLRDEAFNTLVGTVTFLISLTILDYLLTGDRLTMFDLIMLIIFSIYLVTLIIAKKHIKH